MGGEAISDQAVVRAAPGYDHDDTHVTYPHLKNMGQKMLKNGVWETSLYFSNFDENIMRWLRIWVSRPCGSRRVNALFGVPYTRLSPD